MDTAVRYAMKAFWDDHSKDSSVQEMMLDIEADELSKEELPEILSYLPSLHDKDIVELGAGIGRFTGYIADKAQKVLAMDFMETFIEKNKELNKQYSNITYLTADVTNADLQSNGWDMVFSNWLYMYLDDKELEKLLQKVLSWLRVDGFMFCRESCDFPGGNMKTKMNPTHYRSSQEYVSLFHSVTVSSEIDQNVYGFNVVLSKPVDTYVKNKGNEHQIIWLAQKVKRSTKGDE